MRIQSGRIVGLAIAALAFASAAAGAQGKSQEKGKGKSAEHGAQAVKEKRGQEVRTSDGSVVRDRDVRRNRDVRVNRDVYGNRDGYGNRVKVPPGLAKKPGQMPPGQYKKRYGTNEGADVLGGILRRRGYSVLRVVPNGESRYVYYRLRDGSEQRAIVSPGTDRLMFRNVPESLLREVMARLY